MDQYDYVAAFNLSAFYRQSPDGSGLQSATFIVHQTSTDGSELVLGPSITVSVDLVYTNWTEVGVTWNNPPKTFLSNAVQDYQDNDIEIMSADVTSLLSNLQLMQAPTVGFRMTSPYQYVNVYMLEAGGDTLPTLTATYCN